MDGQSFLKTMTGLLDYVANSLQRTCRIDTSVVSAAKVTTEVHFADCSTTLCPTLAELESTRGTKIITTKKSLNNWDLTPFVQLAVTVPVENLLAHHTDGLRSPIIGGNVVINPKAKVYPLSFTTNHHVTLTSAWLHIPSAIMAKIQCYYSITVSQL